MNDMNTPLFYSAYLTLYDEWLLTWNFFSYLRRSDKTVCQNSMRRAISVSYES